MYRYFFYPFLLLAVYLQALSPVVDSLDKAKKIAKLYSKPIICFFDDTLSEGKRGEIAREYFSHPSIYQPFSSTHIFTHSAKGNKGISGFMVLSEKGEILANINTYKDFSLLAERIAKETFLGKTEN